MRNKIEKALFEKWFEGANTEHASRYFIRINDDQPTVALVARDYPHFKMNFIDDHYLDIRSIEVRPADFGRVNIYLVYAVPEDHIDEWKAYIEHRRSKNKRNKSTPPEEFKMSKQLSSTLTVTSQTKIYDFLKNRMSQAELDDFVEKAVYEKMFNQSRWDSLAQEYASTPKLVTEIPNIKLDEIDEFNKGENHRCKYIFADIDAVYLKDLFLHDPKSILKTPNTGWLTHLQLMKILAKYGLEPGMEIQNTD